MDISVQIGGGLFNFRVGVVLINDNRVLLHRRDIDEHWALPGGRVSMFESTAATAAREVEEELGVKINVKRLLWHTENFFTFEGRKFHEIAAYFLVSLATGESLYSGEDSFHGPEGESLIYQWFPISKLRDIELYPVFLREELGNLPEHPKFITIDQENE